MIDLCFNPEFKYQFETGYDSNFLGKIRYSQAWQDIFVIAMLEGKRNGSYLELGGFLPIIANNTYVLERYYQYEGLTIESDSTCLELWKAERPNANIIINKAEAFDYSVLQSYYDYLQVDIDTPRNGFNVLKMLSGIEFGVITFEHDSFTNEPDNISVMNESREYLQDIGYELLINNVAFEPGRGINPYPNPGYFEDWYINPKIIRSEVAAAYKWIEDDVVKYGTNILFR